MRCYKRQASAVCGPGQDGNFASCRHSSHGESTAPDCQFEGIYTVAGQSLQAVRHYAAARWQGEGGIGDPEFTIEPICSSCTALEASTSDLVPTQVDLGKGFATSQTAIHSAVTADGAGTFTIPLWTSPGRMGMEPSLSLGYNSRGGDGVLGKGWSLNGFSRITRCTRTIAQDGAAEPVEFNTLDRFCLDGVRLIAVTGFDGGHLTEYRTESNSFSKIISLNPDDLGPVTFEVHLKNGRILTYGGGPGSRIEGKRVRLLPSGSSSSVVNYDQDVRFGWAVSGVRDRVGNTMQVSYEMTNGESLGHAVEQVPLAISYTGSTQAGAPGPSRTVYLKYGPREDPSTYYVAGLKFGRRQRLNSVEMWGPSPGGNSKLREYRLTYSRSAATGVTLLSSLQECDGTGVCLAPLSTVWSNSEGPDFTKYSTNIRDITRNGGDIAQALWTIHTLDLNGDGKDDILYREYIDPPDGPPQGRWLFRLSTGTGFGPPIHAGIHPSVNLPPIWAGRVADINRDGKADVVKLNEASVVHDIYLGRGAQAMEYRNQFTIEDPTMWGTSTSLPAFYLADLNGDGLPEGIRSVKTSTPGNAWGYRLNTQGELAAEYRVWPMLAFTAGQEEKAYAVPIDGSGRTAFLTRDIGADPYRFTALMLGENNIKIKKPTGLQWTSATDTPYWFLDVTGDGLADAVQLVRSSPYSVDGRRVTVYVNTGNGFLPGVTQEFPSGLHWIGYSEYSGNPNTDYGIRVGDFNRDGRQDFLVANSLTTRTTWLVQEGQADGTFKPRLLDVPLGDMAMDGFKLHRTLDVNGDGSTDIIQVENGELQVYVRNETRPDLLKWVINGDLGGAGFSYKAYSDSPGVFDQPPSLPLSRLSAGLQVVDQHFVDHGQGVASANAYRYKFEGAAVDLHGRGFLGFQTRSVEDLQTGAVHVSFYENLGARVGTAYPHVGRPTFELSRIVNGDGVEHRTERVLTYQVTTELGGRIHSIAPATVRENRMEMQPGQSRSDATLTFGQLVSTAYDSFGNLTWRHVKSLYGDVPTGDESTFEAGYDNNETTWLIGQRRWTRTKSLTAAGTNLTRRTEATYDAATGALVTETIEPTESQYYLRTHYDYDPSGRVIYVREYDWGGNNRSTAIAYEAEGTFPAVITNGIGQQTRLAWHVGLGLQVAESDANGIVTRVKYDGFGRLRSQHRPDGSTVSLSYGRTTFNQKLTVAASSGGTQSTEFDTLGRAVKVDTQGFGGETVQQLTEYDNQGRVRYAYRPYVPGVELPMRTEYVYDKLGRVLFEHRPDGSFAERKYSIRKVESWDARRNLHVFLQDTLGQLVESTDVAPDGKRLQVRFTYGPFGMVEREEQLVNDVLQHAQYPSFDLMGRPTRAFEPQAGGTAHFEQMEYNAWGELKKVTDSSQQVSTITRDRLGRMLRLQSADGETLLSWDSAPGKGVGQLASTLSPDGVASSYRYDSLGRLTDSTWNILGESFTVSREYDSFGRPHSIRYPGAPNPSGRRMEVRFGYNAWGYLNRVYEPGTSEFNIWTAEGRSAMGQLTAERFGNSVTSSREYDPVRGILKRIDSKYQDASQTRNIQALAYGFDLNGNLETRIDERANIIEGFNYDHLDRLKGWTVDAQGRKSSHGYRYDDLGNFLGRDIIEGDGTPISMTYDRTQGFGPHAVTSSTLGSYAYDANGNQTAAPGRQVEYSTFNLPRRILKGADEILLGYTAGQARAYKKSSTGEVTIYVEGVFERRKTATETLYVHHIPADGRIVAQETWREAGGVFTNENMLFMHHDHLGSVETVTDQSGLVVSHHKYDPFGARADPLNPAQALVVPPQLVKWGFTGHEQEDELGLINMRGRMYDPLIGRFLSRDPVVQFPLSGQSYNRYSYVLNNPLRWTDPSGFQIAVQVQAEDPDQAEDGSVTLEGEKTIIEYCLPEECPSGDGAGAEGEMTIEVSAPGADDNGALPASVMMTYGRPDVASSSQTPKAAASSSDQPGAPAFRNGMSSMERLQLALDLGGMIPGIGIAFDLVNAGLSAAQGNWGDAGLSLVGAVPGIGDAIKGAAIVAKVGGVAVAGVAVAKASKAAKGAGQGAQQTFEILDGVRRSKAAEMAGQTTVKAEVIGTGGQVIDVPLDALRSPKTMIDATTNSSLQRWMNTLKQTMSGSPAPPILVQPGTRGTPIPGVTVEY
ncbi:RHS repeat-associated core domain-containing protein [Myxococcus faecalis]|uniref:RHS repeat-associated core domain-containing protein n=1 Tax=Myxococcus faecalis TaxID=3115646 RepID=UPI003CF02AC3